MKFRSFVSNIKLFQENNNTLFIWTEITPSWLPENQSLHLNTQNIDTDMLKVIYYYPGAFVFYVNCKTYEIKKVIVDQNRIRDKCNIL